MNPSASNGRRRGLYRPPSSVVRMGRPRPDVAPPKSKSLAPNPPISPPPKQTTDVIINLNFPKLRLSTLPKPTLRVTKLPSPRHKFIISRRTRAGLGLLAVLAIAGLIWQITSPAGSQPKPAAKTAAAAVQTFTPVFPKDKPELASDPDKTAYDSTRGVYSYSDSLLGTSLIVSQQAMPSSMGSPEQAIPKVAASMGAKDPLAVAGGLAYMSTDPKTGSQVIVTSAKGLLIFIQSPFRHSAADWKNYIESLR